MTKHIIDDVVLVRHEASGMYLTLDQKGEVVLAPLMDSTDSGNHWTYRDNQIIAQRTGTALVVDEANHAVLHEGISRVSHSNCTLRSGDGTYLVRGDGVTLHTTTATEDEAESAFELVPRRSGDGQKKVNKRPKVKTNEDLKSWMPLVGKIVGGAISAGFSAAGAPGGGLVGEAFSMYWGWFSSQAMGEESVETKMEHVMDWVENYVYEKIDEIVRDDIQAAYLSFVQSATRYRQALLNYNKANDTAKDKFRAEVKSEYKFCRGAIDTILNKCESYSTDYADRFILVYTLAMSFYLILMRDTITNAKELQYMPEQVGPMKQELQKRADLYFVRMEKILNEIKLLHFFQGQKRTDCHIGKDPNSAKDPRDTTDTLFMIQIVMKIMRSLLYYNPRYYNNNITLTTGSAILSDNGHDAQVRLTPETKLLQCFHLPEESVGLVDKLGSEKSVTIQMKCTQAHNIGIRVMFATVHSDHNIAKYAYPQEVMPNAIKIDNMQREGTKEFEHKYRLIFDNTSDDNRYFWNRQGVEKDFDTKNYVRYRYQSFGEYKFQPNTTHTLTFPANSRPVFVDAYFVDWQPEPNPLPTKNLIKDTNKNVVDRNDFYYLVSENDRLYLAPDDDSTPRKLVTVSSKPKTQIQFTRQMSGSDYRTQLKYGDVVMMTFVKKHSPMFKQISIRINDKGDLGENNPKWFIITEKGLLQLKDTDKKLAKDTRNAGNVILSGNNESNLYWQFEKYT
jgi:delta endotoxin, N-terminal domain